MASYGSVNSLSSNNSATQATGIPALDSPEQFEVLKQQKEIVEMGLDMWVKTIYFYLISAIFFHLVLHYLHSLSLLLYSLSYEDL